MKTGDILYCIKDTIYNDKIVHKCGKCYQILEIRKKYYITENDNIFIYLLCEDGTTPDDYYGYILTGELKNGMTLLSDSFGKLTDIRKIKLKKLKCVI